MIYVDKSSTKIKSYETFYSSVTYEDDFKKISREVIDGLKGFINTQFHNQHLKNQINYSASFPTTSEKCNIVINLITNNEPIISVVADSVNYHEDSGLNKFIWERRHVIKNKNMVGICNNNDIAIIKTNEGFSVPQITITQSAIKALRQYAEVLKNEELRKETQKVQIEKNQKMLQRQFETLGDRAMRWDSLKLKYQKKMPDGSFFDWAGYSDEITSEKKETGEFQVECMQNTLKSQVACETISANDKRTYIDWFRAPNSSRWIDKRTDLSIGLFMMCIDVNDMTDAEYNEFWPKRYQYNNYTFEGKYVQRLKFLEKENARKSCWDCTLF